MNGRINCLKKLDNLNKLFKSKDSYEWRVTYLHKGGYIMNRNPLIPFLLIAIFGIGLMFLFSFKGIGDREELASGGEEEQTEDVASASPEEIYTKSCISCHGQNYEGGAGPALAGIGDKLSADDIKETIKSGKGIMPAGLVPDEKLDEMAKWVSEIK
jgi:cytochrome c550